MSETEKKILTHEELEGQQSLLDDELMAQMAVAFEGEPTTEEGEDEQTEGETEETEEETEESQETEEAEPKAIELNGRKLKAEEADEALRLLDWANTLSRDQVNAINATLAAQDQPAPTQTPEPTADKEDFLDPRAKEEIETLRKELDELKQPVQTMQFNNQAQQVRFIETQIDVAKTQFQTIHPQADLVAIEAELQSMGIYDRLCAKFNNDYAAAALHGFNMVYATSPDFVQDTVDDKMQQERDELAAKRERKRKAASLAGKGGSVSRVPAPPSNKQERDAAMVEEIAAALSNS